MSRRGNIILGATIVGLGGGFLIYRSVKRNKLFDEISAAIGGPGNAISKYTEFFSPNYYKQFQEGEAIFQSTGNVLQWANEFNNSFGYFNDDEDKAYGVLRSIPDGVALSQVSEKYNNKFGEDLESKLKSFDKDEQNIVGNILSEKPPYRIPVIS